MKREIKFRGKCNGRWVYGDAYSYNGDTYIHEVDPDCVGDTFLAEQNTIGEFTGLYDKNGREIYEGDIVKWSYDGLCYVVAFRRGMFFASAHELNEDVYGGYPLWMICDDNDLCEIIGNIHDNPSMLKNS